MRGRQPVKALEAVALITAAAIQAGPFYVDASRPDDSGDGLSWATAKKTIQAAVNAVADMNDTVWVTNGIYSTAGASSIQMDVTGMVVRSVNGSGVTTVSGGGANSIFYIQNASDCLIEGFTIANGIAGSSPLRGGGGVAVGTAGSICTNNTVSRCRITNCQFPIYRHNYPTAWSVTLIDSCISCCSSGATMGGRGRLIASEISSNDWNGIGGFTYASNVLFKANRGTSSNGGGAVADTPQNINGEFHDCRFIKNHTQYAGGALAFDNFWRTGPDWLFRNCLFAGNEGSHGGAVRINNMKKMTFENCTFTANRATAGAGYGGGIYCNCTGGLYIVNSIIISNVSTYSPDVFPDTSAVGMTNCCSSYSPPLGQGTNNINAWPLFVDWGAGLGTNNTGADFRLQIESPCVNTGTNQDWMTGASDLAGNPRLCGIVDMGAYEYRYPRGTIVIFRGW